VVHVGIVLMFVGFAGTAYQKETEITSWREPRPRWEVHNRPLRIAWPTRKTAKKRWSPARSRHWSTARSSIHLRPAKWFFRNHERRTDDRGGHSPLPAEDLYVTLGGYDLAEGTATLKIVVNPVVDWIWFGFMLLAIGTAIALIPDTVLERVAVRVPARDAGGASGSSGVAGVLIWHGGRRHGRGPGARRRRARRGGAGHDRAPRRSRRPARRRRELVGAQIICQCGTCRHALLDCASEGCGHAAQDPHHDS